MLGLHPANERRLSLAWRKPRISPENEEVTNGRNWFSGSQPWGLNYLGDMALTQAFK